MIMLDEDIEKQTIYNLIKEALTGSYTKAGVEGWFFRPRAALNGMTPIRYINQQPYDRENARKVYELALNVRDGGMGT